MKRNDILQAKANEVLKYLQEQIDKLPKPEEKYVDFVESQTFPLGNSSLSVDVVYTMKDNNLTLSSFCHQNIPFVSAVRCLVDNWDTIKSFVQVCLHDAAISLDEDMIVFQKFMEK